MSCRIDKYAWSVRLAKTRSKAAEAVSKGKIRLNGEHVKPARDVKLGDEVQIIIHTATFNYKVIQLLERRVGAKQVPDYLLDITEEEEFGENKKVGFLQSQDTKTQSLRKQLKNDEIIAMHTHINQQKLGQSTATLKTLQ